MYRYIIIFLMVLPLCGCTSIKAVFAMTKSTDHFVALKDNPAVFYEEGAEQYSALISPLMNDAIQIVENKQYAAFPDPVNVYITSSLDSFSSYCASEKPKACVIGNRLFLSPKLFNSDRKISGILLHELSHLQLSQSIGRWSYQLNIPSWFSEGLATYISQGAGAENVTREQAIQAIKSGESIKPNASGSLFFPKTASDFGLEPHMFYRQSSLFVEWLHDLNKANFKQLMMLLRDDNTVEEAMLKSYGFAIADGWQRFTQGIKT